MNRLHHRYRMNQRPRRNKVLEFLCAEKMPLWVTFMLFIMTAVGTYLLAPVINQEFERQKIRSAYVVENLNNLNLISRTLISDISIYNNNLIDTGKRDNDTKQKINSQITELQWRALELDIIFDDSCSYKIIQKYKASLDRVRQDLEDVQNPKDVKSINYSVRSYAQVSMKVIELLAERGDVKAVDTPMTKKISQIFSSKKCETE